MSFYAANPAGSPHLSPRLVEQANNSLQTRNGGGECAVLVTDMPARSELQLRGLPQPGCR